ncbi:hypothetical protein [Bradyrhizobium neotropicale]|uniref:hypothetical protein n=1 Tax=Bradyrhizobium neotropicale TaxID=1497615 RepID=UPI001AD7DAFE|nr:hypothetical protein [Bradyrhizobium neotropicale]MBO4228060.1 hypothetical protein [Bradyrhizobium neotropicale]
MNVVWREWFNEAAIKQMTEMGTLPRNETEVSVGSHDNGEDVAALVAEDVAKEDSEAFRDGGTIVILEPEDFAGEYDIEVEYTPTYFARER